MSGKRYQYKTHAVRFQLGVAAGGKSWISTACGKTVEASQTSKDFTCALCALAEKAERARSSRLDL